MRPKVCVDGVEMARVFITGSADGLGRMAAELLIEQDHTVVLHARSVDRAAEIRKTFFGAEEIVVGDLSSIAETKAVADQVNGLGGFDAVIHNAGIGYREPKLVKTVDGLPQLFAVNSLAPYILTALVAMPKRLIYLSSGMHFGAGSHMGDMLWETRRWNGSQAYAETKFQNVLLAFAIARSRFIMSKSDMVRLSFSKLPRPGDVAVQASLRDSKSTPSYRSAMAAAL